MIPIYIRDMAIEVREPGIWRAIEKEFKTTDINVVRINGYPWWFNLSTGQLTHTRSFGDDDDYKYGTDLGMTAAYDDGFIELSYYSYGGMCGLSIDEDTCQYVLKSGDPSADSARALITYMQEFFKAYENMVCF
ncbi:hypothetical protein QP246_02365 [Aerococcus urinae]|uniref:hypothetical protein n=1 Tax=Aerococcus urinae TaxID=1376 RepID=UPI00254C8424|nr:hypothetical protein [Aerococcus urinae]MDK6688303.1 hypothetical protein [Aerococcus urinae]